MGGCPPWSTRGSAPGYNLIPKVAPHAIQKTEITEGYGGAGTIKKITFGEGSQFKYVKHRIDEVEQANFKYSYSLIEGDALGEGLDHPLMEEAS
ncbi:Major allergen Pru av 1 [Morella rubra]|uniref:Major allergen Pru av 1 n=1 Tax=Morella rubra TaxID=262757 RepID=A0A6A1VM80_9ROSI|nr:Major allergen Pru av 1 [Morella rubra]